jgi:glyoxylase-like metal-dependent hydrolase (beta-lactamase superfamily II)
MPNARISRREFVWSAAALAGAAALPPFARAQERAAPKAATFFEWKEVRPGFHIASSRTGDDMTLVNGNSTLVVEPGRAKGGRAVLIDTKQAVLGPALRREAMDRCEGLHRVINTHHHFDHSGGNAAAGAGGVILMAHPKCRERIMTGIAQLTAQLDQKIAALEQSSLEGAGEAAADAKKFKEELGNLKPEAFVPEAMPIDTKELARHKVEVHHTGPGHTDNDLFFFFPQADVLVAGDLLFNGLHPYYDKSAGATSAGWVRALGRMVELCGKDTVVVPGHGAVTDIEGVKKQIKYFEDARAAVEKAVQEGKPREEVEKMRLPQYGSYGLQVAVGFLMGGLWDEFTRKDAK